MDPINEHHIMTIFPELANPNHIPQVMSFYPYLSDTQVKKRVIQLTSSIFQYEMSEMDEEFTQTKLRRFLIDNRNNLFNMVEELMTEYEEVDDEDDDEDDEEVDQNLVDRLLRDEIIDMFESYIDIQEWIENRAQAQSRP